MNFDLSFLHFIWNQSHSPLIICQVLLHRFQLLYRFIKKKKMQFNGRTMVFFIVTGTIHLMPATIKELFFLFLFWIVYINFDTMNTELNRFARKKFHRKSSYQRSTVQRLNWTNSTTKKITNVQRRTRRVIPFLYSPMSLHNSMHKNVFVHLFDFFFCFHFSFGH